MKLYLMAGYLTFLFPIISAHRGDRGKNVTCI